jgi:ATP-dependent DNA helicase RecG
MSFRIGNTYRDAEILKAAGEAASWVMELDPELSLPQHEILRSRLNKVLVEENCIPGM